MGEPRKSRVVVVDFYFVFLTYAESRNEKFKEQCTSQVFTEVENSKSHQAKKFLPLGLDRR